MVMMPGRWTRWPVVALLVLGAVACATPPLTAPGPGPSLTPRDAVATGLPPTEQLWGGVIVGLDNRADHTLLEVVSYPLRNQEPQTGRMTDGRFRLEVRGFLDPIDYRTGRRITARGLIQRTEAGRIGEVEYVFPVMVASDLYLWPEVTARDWRPGGVTFGIGIGIGL
jgi:outer membrane lipoprotein